MKAVWLTMWFIGFFGLLGCIAYIAGCSECSTNSTRCYGNIAQICNADEQWETVLDCSTIEPGEWECCALGGEESWVGCLPADECN